MAEKVLKIKTLSEVAEAISGLTDLSGSLKGVGTAAVEASGKAKAEWKALEAEWTKSTATAKGVADAVFKTESALNAMGRAGSQSQLEAGLVKSKVAFDQLQAKIREVAATGGTLDDGVVASMNTMRAAIDAGKAKLNELKTTTAEAKRELGLLGDEGKKAGGGIAGVGEKAGALTDKFKKSTEGLNKFRASAMETWAALQIGVQIGNALADAIDSWDAKRAISDKAQADAAVKAALLDQANRAVTKGLIEQGKTTDETIKHYVEMTLKMGKLTEQGKAYVASMAGMKAPRIWADIEAQAEGMAIALEGAYKRSEEEGNRWALENASAIRSPPNEPLPPARRGPGLAIVSRWGEPRRGGGNFFTNRGDWGAAATFRPCECGADRHTGPRGSRPRGGGSFRTTERNAMKTLSTETQAGLFAAAVAVAETLKRIAPEETHAFAGAAHIIAVVAPTYQELTDWQLSEGLPTIDKASYEEAVRAASLHALVALASPGVQH